MSVKLRVLFYLQKSRINKKHKCPIRCRITFNSRRKEFSTGLFINPNHWKSKKQKAYIPDDNDYTNNQISLIRQELNQAFLYLKMNDENFDVRDVYSLYRGNGVKSDKTLLEVFDLHNNRMEKLIGKEYSRSTLNKFKEAKKHLLNFFKSSYKRNDILLEKITLKFIDDLDFYLKSELNHKQITINKTIQRIRKIIKIALAEGYITTDPFILYKPKRVINNLIYLTKDELKNLEEYNFKQNRLQHVKDLFIFCCYTGLAYQEMNSFTKNNIVVGFDNNDWIEMYRKKTKSSLSIPLLNNAKIILNKYNYELPKISNQKFNSYLKEIAHIVGIEKNLTHHIARKTFATTVLLSNNISIEVVSKLLGHSKIQTTQKHYGEVVKKRISDEIRRLYK